MQTEQQTDKRVEIIPAILPKDYQEVVDKAASIRDLAKRVQVDICDGRFVNSVTWPFAKRDLNFEEILKEEKGMPFWENLDYEFDLMVNFDKPEDVDEWIQIGATRLVVHAESKGDIEAVLKRINSQVEVGLALNIDTPLTEIEKFKDKIQFVQLMGIDEIGKQGQEFDPLDLERVKKLRNMCPELPISVDGGVSFENAKALIEAGATRLVIGSAIFGAEDILGTFRKFEELA